MVAGLALLSNYFILRYGEDSGLLKVVKKNTLNRLWKIKNETITPSPFSIEIFYFTSFHAAGIPAQLQST